MVQPSTEWMKFIPLESSMSCCHKQDFLFLSTPLTTETANLIDRRRQSLMKRGAGVINVGRAGYHGLHGVD